MNAETAATVHDRMRAAAKYKERQSTTERDAAIEALRDTFSDVPDAWVLDWVRTETRKGVEPTIISLGTAWAAETKSRLSKQRGTIAAPLAIEVDPVLATQWRRTFNAALIQGGTEQQAYEYANAIHNVTPEPAHLLDPSIKNQIFARLHAMSRRGHFDPPTAKEEV